MKRIDLQFVAISALAMMAASSPFELTELSTHQPIGNPGGQVNYYNIGFTVKSSNSGSSKSAYCWSFWGDNCNSCVDSYPWSQYVPTTDWIRCWTDRDMETSSDAFQFKLFPYFSIGNFSLEVKEGLSNGRSASGFKHVTNGTSQFTCQINPREVPGQQHASGDCSVPSSAESIKIPLSQASARRGGG